MWSKLHLTFTWSWRTVTYPTAEPEKLAPLNLVPETDEELSLFTVTATPNAATPTPLPTAEAQETAAPTPTVTPAPIYWEWQSGG